MIVDKDVDDLIRRHITWLCSYVSSNNQYNLQDINIYSEGFIGELLNKVFSCKFVNLNTYNDKNYPGIDLGDETTKVSAQVTSSRNRSKVDDTLEKFKTHKHHLTYDTLYIVLITFTKPNFRKEFKCDYPKSFNSGEHILSANELCGKICKLDLKTKREIVDFLKTNLAKEPDSANSVITLEAYLFQQFFKLVAELDDNKASESSEIISEADLVNKKERFKDYWDYLQTAYAKVVDTRLQKVFSTVISNFDQSQREKIKEFLERESMKLLAQNKDKDPIWVITQLRDEIIRRANLFLISESEVENFLYYQFYLCNVLPNAEVRA